MTRLICNRCVSSVYFTCLICLASSIEITAAGELRLTPCEREDISPPAKCGTFTVWENRDTQAGRKIDLRVVVLEASGPTKRPDAYLYLMGGPGEAATSMASEFNRHRVREQRDVLLVDVRGAGNSNGLYCQPAPTAPLQEFMPLMDARRTQQCVIALSQQADLRYYLTSHAMDDLDELRAALGYQQINIEAGSHGTLGALTYIERHGEHVRSAILLAATGRSLPMPRYAAIDTEGAMRSVLSDCAADADCAAAFPKLQQEYATAVRKINERGSVAVRVRDPRDSQMHEVRMSATDFAESLRALLYQPETTRRIPFLLHRAATRDDYTPFAQFQVERNIAIAASIAKGLYFAVTCTEDIARVKPEEVYAAGRGTFLDDHRARPHIESCKGWPLGRLPDGFSQEVRSNVPVLIVNGASDPATPPYAAHAAASRMMNARVLIVPQGSHGLRGLNDAKCIDDILWRFLETPRPHALDASCLAAVRRKPFVVNDAEQ